MAKDNKNLTCKNNWTVPEKTVEALKKLAEKENRNASNMATVLIQEALEKRGIQYN